MASYFAGRLERRAMEKHGGEVVIALIWLTFYLYMVVEALFANRDGFMMPLALLAAIFGGWGLLGWRRKKKAGRVIQIDDVAAIYSHQFVEGGELGERIRRGSRS